MELVIRQLVEECALINTNDKILILFDLKTKSIAQNIYSYIKNKKIFQNIHIKSVDNLKIHGDEPDSQTQDLIKKSTLIYCLTSFSLAHCQSVKNTLKKGGRFLSLPDYSNEVIKSEAFKAKFLSYREGCIEVSKILTKANKVKVKTSLGTNIEFFLKNRTSNSAPGCVLNPGDLSSPPDIESNIAPVEDLTNGVLIIDGSVPIPSIGLLINPLKIFVENGVCKEIQGDSNVVSKLEAKLTKNKIRRTVGEFGIGLNPYSKIVGRMLEDEGAFNTCHFGIGANTTIGGLNKCNGHIDLVMKNPNFEIDGTEIDLFHVFKSKIKL